MSRSNILKQGTKEMRMYEYFVIYTLGNQYSAINFNVYCEDIIKIETIQKMENNSFFTTFIDYISGYFDLWNWIILINVIKNKTDIIITYT